MASHKERILEGVARKDFCARSEPQDRTHPFHHVLPDSHIEASRRAELVARDMSETFKTMPPSINRRQTTMNVMTAYADRDACETACAHVIDANADLIAEWLKIAEEAGPTEHPPTLTISTTGEIDHHARTGRDTSAAARCTTQARRFTNQDLMAMPDTSFAFAVVSRNPQHEHRRPAKAAILRAEHQSITLQYNPNSPYGFDVVTTYPMAQTVRANVNSRFAHTANLSRDIVSCLKDAYLQTPFARQDTISRKHDNVSVIASLTDGVRVWDNVDDGIQISVDRNGRRTRYRLFEDGMTRDDRGHENKVVPRYEPALAPIRQQLDALFEMFASNTAYPKPHRMQRDEAAQNLLEDVTCANQNPKSGTYSPSRLAPWSRREPLTLVMIAFDKQKQHALQLRPDGAYIMNTVSSKNAAKLSVASLGHEPTSDFERELARFKDDIIDYIRRHEDSQDSRSPEEMLEDLRERDARDAERTTNTPIATSVLDFRKKPRDGISYV